jgi:3-oxoacyl-[acyl-carrier protein] reductase
MPIKHIIITGASKGIGAETAKYLCSKNIAVTAIARSQKKLTGLQQMYPDLLFPLVLDITLSSAASDITAHLKKNKLSIDGFIHNAGLLINKKFLDLSDDDWNQQINVNLLAPARLTRDLTSFFNRQSHIVCISSMGGYQGSSKFPGLTAYSASKGALSIMSECLAVELAEYNISCNSLCLGAVQTEMLNQAFPGLKAPLTAEETGRYVGEFVLTGHQYYNGQVLPVTVGNPD